MKLSTYLWRGFMAFILIGLLVVINKHAMTSVIGDDLSAILTSQGVEKAAGKVDYLLWIFSSILSMISYSVILLIELVSRAHERLRNYR